MNKRKRHIALAVFALLIFGTIVYYICWINSDFYSVKTDRLAMPDALDENVLRRRYSGDYPFFKYILVNIQNKKTGENCSILTFQSDWKEICEVLHIVKDDEKTEKNEYTEYMIKNYNKNF